MPPMASCPIKVVDTVTVCVTPGVSKTVRNTRSPVGMPAVTASTFRFVGPSMIPSSVCLVVVAAVLALFTESGVVTVAVVPNLNMTSVSCAIAAVAVVMVRTRIIIIIIVAMTMDATRGDFAVRPRAPH